MTEYTPEQIAVILFQRYPTNGFAPDMSPQSMPDMRRRLVKQLGESVIMDARPVYKLLADRDLKPHADFRAQGFSDDSIDRFFKAAYYAYNDICFQHRINSGLVPAQDIENELYDFTLTVLKEFREENPLLFQPGYAAPQEEYDYSV